MLSRYLRRLTLVLEKGLDTVAFPAISTGIYGYPLNEAAQVSSRAIEQFLALKAAPEEVRLVFFGRADAEEFVEHQMFER